MLPKLIAGIVCGAAAALPGKYMMSTMLQSVMVAMMQSPGDLAMAVAATPFVVFALVIFICAMAPNVVGAWFRGCLMVTIVAAGFALQALQCFGIEWLFDQVFDDPGVRHAASAGCPEEITPFATIASLVAAVAFGAGAIVVWGMGKRSATNDY